MDAAELCCADQLLRWLWTHPWLSTSHVSTKPGAVQLWLAKQAMLEGRVCALLEGRVYAVLEGSLHALRARLCCKLMLI